MTLLWLLLLPLTPSPEVVESIEVNCYGQQVQTIWRGQDGIVKEWRHYKPEHEPGPTGMAVWWERGRFWMVQAEMLLRTQGFDREVQQRRWWPDEFRSRLR